MAITPIPPVDRERLVPTNTSILLDFDESPTLVRVEGVEVYDGITWINGWSGKLLAKDSGWRLVLDTPSYPAAHFTVGDIINVQAYSASDSLEYLFEVGLEAITSTNDVGSPRIIEAESTHVWVGYVRDPGQLVLRKADPLTAEVDVVPAAKVDLGYDPDLGKVIILYVNNDSVLQSLGDPEDTPTTIPPEETLTQGVSAYPAAGKGWTYHFGPTINTYPPQKTNQGDPVSLYGAAGKGWTYRLGYSSYLNTPEVAVLVVDNEVTAILTITPLTPSQLPDHDDCVGFMLYKKTGSILQRLGFIPWDGTQNQVIIEDPFIFYSTQYAVAAVYQRDNSNRRFEGRISAWADTPRFSDKITLYGGTGKGWTYHFGPTINTYPPQKTNQGEPISIYGTVGIDGQPYINISGFGQIGIG